MLTQSSRLLSLALVPANGEWFYAVFTDVSTKDLSTWHQKNTVPHMALTEAQLNALPPGKYIRGNRREIVTALSDYLIGFDKIVMWADVPAYDWVLFCELFGGALNLPENIHYIVRDLATFLEARGYDPDIDRFTLAYGNKTENVSADLLHDRAVGATATGLLSHNALGDAMACRACFNKVTEPQNSAR